MIFVKNYSWIIIKLILIPFIIISCSSKNKVKTVEKNDMEIYNNALSLSLDGNHEKAAIEFDNLNLNYPYSKLSSKAQIMTAYSLYENNDFKKAIINLQSFLEMNPSGEFSEYAQYLLAMCYYIQIPNQERDPSLSKKVINYFKILISKYPDSKYEPVDIELFTLDFTGAQNRQRNDFNISTSNTKNGYGSINNTASS